jgi:hypothetical protein
MCHEAISGRQRESGSRAAALQRLEDFDGEEMGAEADGDHGDEGVGARAENGEVGGVLVDNEEHGGYFADFGRRETHRGRGGSDRDGLSGATIEDIEGHDAACGAVSDVHFGGIGGDDGGGGGGTEEHVVANFVGPGVDGLEAMRFRSDDIEFAAIGLEEHAGGLASEFEIGEEERALEIDDGEAILRAAHDEGDGTVGENDDVIGLRDDGDGSELLESGGVVDGEGGRAAVEDEDVFVVGSDASEDGLGTGPGAAKNGAGGGVKSDELVVRGGGGVDAIAGGREVEGVGRRADGNASNLTGRRIEDPNVAGGRADAPDFVARGMFTEIGDGRADGDVGDNVKAGKIDDGEGAVVCGDVGVHVEVGAKEGRAMLAKEDDGGGDEEEDEREVDA